MAFGTAADQLFKTFPGGRNDQMKHMVPYHSLMIKLKKHHLFHDNHHTVSKIILLSLVHYFASVPPFLNVPRCDRCLSSILHATSAQTPVFPACLPSASPYVGLAASARFNLHDRLVGLEANVSAYTCPKSKGEVSYCNTFISQS